MHKKYKKSKNDWYFGYAMISYIIGGVGYDGANSSFSIIKTSEYKEC